MMVVKSVTPGVMWHLVGAQFSNEASSILPLSFRRRPRAQLAPSPLHARAHTLAIDTDSEQRDAARAPATDGDINTSTPGVSVPKRTNRHPFNMHHQHGSDDDAELEFPRFRPRVNSSQHLAHPFGQCWVKEPGGEPCGCTVTDQPLKL